MRTNRKQADGSKLCKALGKLLLQIGIFYGRGYARHDQPRDTTKVLKPFGERVCFGTQVFWQAAGYVEALDAREFHRELGQSPCRNPMWVWPGFVLEKT